MKLERCQNGHFFDADRFQECPHCNQTTLSTVLQDEDGNPEYTLPVNESEEASNRLEDLVKNAKGDENSQVTIGYFGEINSEPVVGWLVAIDGAHFGQDFKLKTGRNFIGRSKGMDVILSEDQSVSRDRHAIVLYEPKSNIFLVQPGDAKELFYLNDNVVLSAEKIKANDVLTIGGTKLLFIPCCSEVFNWDMVKKEENK